MDYIYIREEGWKSNYDPEIKYPDEDYMILNLATLEVRKQASDRIGMLAVDKERKGYSRFMDLGETVECDFRKFSYKRLGGKDLVRIRGKKYEFSHFIEGAKLVITESSTGMHASLDLGEVMEVYVLDEDAEDGKSPIEDWSDMDFEVCDCGFLYIFGYDEYLVGRYGIALKYFDGTDMHSHYEVISVFWSRRGSCLGVGTLADNDMGMTYLEFDNDANCYIEDEVFEHGLFDLPY